MAPTLRALLVTVILAASHWFTPSLQAQTIYILTSDGKLVSAPLYNVANTTTPVTIQGVNAGEMLVAIDVRPQNQQLYALGVNAVANTATLYRVSPETGFAAALGTPGGIAFTTDGVTPADFPTPTSVGWDIDFNPAADRLRVVALSLNFRVNPNTGAPVDGDNTGLSSGSVTGINPDGPINSGSITAGGVAYTNNEPNNGGTTTLYTLDGATNSIFIQNPANSGTLTQGQVVTLNGFTLDFSLLTGFDIAPGVNAAASNMPVTSGSAVALIDFGGNVSTLYTIDLVTAAATFKGHILSGRSVAIRTELGAAIALTSDGTSLVRFSTSSPGTTTTQALASPSAGETLVGIDSRPQTAQLYALGVNPTTDTASLYVVDPQTGALTVVGSAGQIQFTTDGVTPVQLPDPANVGYGFDFNPTVDRIRVVTFNGLNFRINPNNGAAVDGNNGGADVNGTNPDGAITGTAAPGLGVAATAYTNSYAQSLVGGTTTQYTLEPLSNQLFIQNPPNAGTQTEPRSVNLDYIPSTPLNFDTAVSFDIPSSVAVTTSNTRAIGEGWIAARVGGPDGATGLYRLDLATGAAFSVGNIGSGTTTLTGLTVFTTPVIGVDLFDGMPLGDGLSLLSFGEEAVGRTSERTVKLTNTGSQTLNYTLVIPSPNFGVVGESTGRILPGGYRFVTFIFSPTAVGALNTQISILSNDPLIPSYEITLAGKGLYPLAGDGVTVVDGYTRVYVLANDGLSENAVITSVSDPSIIIDGRSLIIPSRPAGFTSFAYWTLDNGVVGQGIVSLAPGDVVVDATNFNGLLYASGGEIAGFATAKISPSGLVTLRIAGGTAKASAKISVPALGDTGSAYTALGYVTVVRNLNGTLDLSIDALGGSISGLLKPLKTQSAPANYHIALASIHSTIPGGGYAITTVSPKGAVRINGKLPDGIAFSAASGVQDSGAISFYTPLTKGAKPPAFVGGELVPANLETTDINGELAWVKLPQTTAKGLHVGGVSTTIVANGSLYSNEVELPAGAGTLTLSGGDLAMTESNAVTIKNGVPAVPTGLVQSWTGVNVRSGTFKARVTVPGLDKPVKGNGIYLPKCNSAWGFFPGTTIGGRIELIGP